MNRREAILSIGGAVAAGLLRAPEAFAVATPAQDDPVKALRDLVAIQCADGNWNYDPYMQGLANGLILALSLFEGGRPEYLEAPAVWLADLPKPVIACTGECSE